MKNLRPTLVVILSLFILFSSCTHSEVDSLFEQSSTERILEQKQQLKDLLTSSEHGWKFVYFTDPKKLGGFTHLFQFDSEGFVTMASDFDEDTAAYRSEYDIILASTIALSFTTKNKIHLLSDSSNNPIPSLKGQGYKGDFIFRYYGRNGEDLIFRSNRDFLELRFTKASEADWKNLSQHRAMIPYVLGLPNMPLFRGIEIHNSSDSNRFDFEYNTASRFAKISSPVAVYNENNGVGIAYQADGIQISEPIDLGGEWVCEFKLDPKTNNFTATGANGSFATIKYQSSPVIKTEDYKKLLSGNAGSRFLFDADELKNAPANSPLFVDLLHKVNAAINDQLQSISLEFNHKGNLNAIQYEFKNRPALIHQIRVSEGSNQTLLLTSLGWNSNTVDPSIQALNEHFLDSSGLYVRVEDYKISYLNNIVTFTAGSTPFRITTYDLDSLF